MVMVIGVIFLSVMGISHFFLKYRHTHRDVYFQDYTDLHSFPRDFVEGWIWCNQPDRPLSIALAAGWSNSGHNWFYYPLMGSRWQNKVVYASIDHKGPYSTLASRGLRGSHTDFSAWIYNLQMLRVDLVFIQSPWPLELTWAQQHPQYFKKECAGESFYIFRFLRDPKVKDPI
jgi:hypothetical protein